MSITVTAIVSVTITVRLVVTLCVNLSCSLYCYCHHHRLCSGHLHCLQRLGLLKTVHIFKSTFHHIKYNELVLNAFPKRNVLSCFLKEARLLQDLIGNGNEFQKLGAVLAKARFLSVG